jgi:hypothetical protein
MFLFQEIRPPEKELHCFADLGQSGRGGGRAGNQNYIFSRTNPGEQGPAGFTEQAFDPVARHRASKAAAGGHAKPGHDLIRGADNQHDKRVRVRLSAATHPLEIC